MSIPRLSPGVIDHSPTAIVSVNEAAAIDPVGSTPAVEAILTGT